MGREDPLEKGIATHSSILAWRIPRTEQPSGLQSMGLQRVGHDEGLTLSLPCIYITESLCCTLENNTTLQINSTSIKIITFIFQNLFKDFGSCLMS